MQVGNYNSIGECSTIPIAYTMYGHLEQYYTHLSHCEDDSLLVIQLLQVQVDGRWNLFQNKIKLTYHENAS